MREELREVAALSGSSRTAKLLTVMGLKRGIRGIRSSRSDLEGPSVAGSLCGCGSARSSYLYGIKAEDGRRLRELNVARRLSKTMVGTVEVVSGSFSEDVFDTSVKIYYYTTKKFKIIRLIGITRINL